MKKLFLSLIAVSMSSVTVAQLNKGRMMLGLGFNTQNSKTSFSDTSNSNTTNQSNKNNVNNASLRYGYFISDGFMLGVLGNFHNSTFQSSTSSISSGSSFNSSNKSVSNNFSAGLFSRYYKMIGKSRFAWFAEIAASYGGGKTKYSRETNGINDPLSSSEGKSISFNALLRPGLTYFFTNTIAVEAFFGNVGYNYSKNDSGLDSSPRSSTVINSGFNSRLDFSLSSVFLGVNFYFGGKRT